MKDVSAKFNTLRTARACATLLSGDVGIKALREGRVPKGHLFEIAQVAGVSAAKKTSETIPYCHNVPLDYVNIEYQEVEKGVRVVCTVKAIWKTGVEMEALVGATAGVLTLYDMLKPIEDNLLITDIKVMEKRGGKSDFKDSGENLKAAVLVLSTSTYKGKRKDTSGKTIRDSLIGHGVEVRDVEVLPDDAEKLRVRLLELSDQGLDLVITSGGTGLSPTDVTREVTEAVIEKRLEGVEESIRSYGRKRNPRAMLSRAIAGVVKKTIVINIAGSEGAAKDVVAALFPALFHAFAMVRGEGH